jgi:hypothetical protein
MVIIIYADFSCPYSYLASLRADQLLWSGAAEIDWRAITHRRGPSDGGPRPDDGNDDRDRGLAAVAALARPGEQGPHPLAGPVNEGATVAAYAEAVSDGVQDQLRRRLFDAIWTEARRVSIVDEVRHLIADVMCPPEPIWPRLISPDLPGALLHDPDVNRIVRRSGGTVTLYDGPLTATGSRRIRQWQQEWLALPHPLTPVVIAPDGAVLPRLGALRYLAAAASIGTPSPPALDQQIPERADRDGLRPGPLPRSQRGAVAGMPPGGLAARR